MTVRASHRRTARIPDPEEELAALRTEAATCRACPLWRGTTQTVFGEGPVGAPLMLVGEQPGDQEDRIGRPFVGPAGLLLRRALVEVGIDPDRQYVTNAVKHFKYLHRGKRRIHQKPNAGEIDICRQRWLFREIELVRPRLIVALGATASCRRKHRLPSSSRSTPRPSSALSTRRIGGRPIDSSPATWRRRRSLVASENWPFRATHHAGLGAQWSGVASLSCANPDRRMRNDAGAGINRRPL
jgi:uracil-DNA glycosylase family protein